MARLKAYLLFDFWKGVVKVKEPFFASVSFGLENKRQIKLV